MQASTIFAIISVFATSAIANVQCHVRLVAESGFSGCYNFPRSAFVPNTVFPLGNGCSLQATPEGNENDCRGFVNKLTSPQCGSGRDITFGEGLC